jgi:hypothetical protein
MSFPFVKVSLKLIMSFPFVKDKTIHNNT